MFPCGLLFFFAALFFFSGCVGPGHQRTVHANAAHKPLTPGATLPGKRQLVVFLDGTANEFSDATNVRRLYELTAVQVSPNVLCYYDQGVGTGELGSSGSIVRKAVGGGMGFGFQKNLREAIAFLTEHYRDGDEISIFGFSRGAYAGLVLSTMLGHAGIPILDPIAGESNASRQRRAEKLAAKHYQQLKRAASAAERVANKATDRPLLSGSAARWRGLPAEEASAWRAAYWQALNSQTAWSSAEHSVHRPDISVLGLWDPVDALAWRISDIWKLSRSTSHKGEYARHRGHHFHPVAFGPYIQNCYIALSLDEQRQAFLPQLPDIRFGQPRKYEFVWFVGDHSDLGGGHSDTKDLGGISMNWMLERVGERLLGPYGKRFRVSSDPAAPRHDLVREDIWRLGSYRVRGEVFGKDAAVRVKDSEGRYTLTPLRSEGWKMKVHSSVLARMRSSHDWFKSSDLDNAIDLARERHATKPNGPATYTPRPFTYSRITPNAAESGANAWVSHDWTSSDIRNAFPIAE